MNSGAGKLILSALFLLKEAYALLITHFSEIKLLFYRELTLGNYHYEINYEN